MDELTRAIDAHLQAVGAPAVRAVEPLLGGACQDLFAVDLADGQRLVLRGDAASSLPGSLPRRAEYRVISRAVAAGVRTPAVRWPSEDLLRPGASAYFMDWVDGVTIARKILRNPELADARAALPDQLAAELVAIHAIAPDDDDLGMAVPDDPAAAAIAMHRAGVDALPTPRPVFELALRWLAERKPPPVAPRLCHGDFRTGNFAVTASGLTGVLDWEFAHWGDPADDIAWLCVRDWRFGNNRLPVGGLTDRATFYRAYRAAGGAAVEPARVRYWEIMNNLRWAIGAVCQGERYLSGAETDLELIAIGRRAVQLEWEILRLLDQEA